MHFKIGAVVAFGVLIVACGSSSDGSSSTSSSGSFGTSSGNSAAGVDCTHPGAGSKINDTQCACDSSTHSIAGSWDSTMSCRENNACVVTNQQASFTVTQSGSAITVTTDGTSAKLTGTLCGDYVVFDGPKDSGTQCGQLRLTDDTHWFFDSCYVASGDCARTFGSGCPEEKGQCTGVGAKPPNTAPPVIVKNICN